VLAHREWLVGLVTVADLDGGGTFFGVAHAGIVACTPDADRGVLRQFAVQVVGVSITVVPSGERHCDGGRNPTVHTGGSAMDCANPPGAKPVGLLVGAYELVAAT
jgi:hypothetical protein